MISVIGGVLLLAIGNVFMGVVGVLVTEGSDDEDKRSARVVSALCTSLVCNVVGALLL